ncbi:hypothetical protein [uncultured Chryseobacterium sp.]|uniref:hypothetical protein n=1 Tax=uncultured Chryseobacterium sp. TaxID=259322 RepID=UPI0025E621ED|nr:hypothetical protein [uncultured Chryseobacterium sp.]
MYFFYHKKFDSRIWKKHPERRKYYLKDLLDNGLIIGKSPVEAEEVLGRNESHSMKEDRWTYTLYTDTGIQRKYFLALYFKDGRISKARKEFKILY